VRLCTARYKETNFHGFRYRAQNIRDKRIPLCGWKRIPFETPSHESIIEHGTFWYGINFQYGVLRKESVPEKVLSTEISVRNPDWKDFFQKPDSILMLRMLRHTEVIRSPWCNCSRNICIVEKIAVRNT
jgi:hypothetical protein